ncbi:uridylate kinase PUMPKIN, chloroplastic-like [Euphorbia lathyris]|uniref:uridylate kinase PUMPKIN, chloroplastic-like n=1 Tax=Euphorbia lathyris TaxID=212925 RepID=UPI00331399EE
MWVSRRTVPPGCPIQTSFRLATPKAANSVTLSSLLRHSNLTSSLFPFFFSPFFSLMATDDFPLINDTHAPTRLPNAESVSGGDYYASYADSEQDKSGSGALTTPSLKHHHHYYHNSGNTNKRQKPNGIGESESNINANAVDYRSDYRKDREEWSDTAISCLLEAYMEKYNQLNRGNLRGRDWEEVAEAVSERGGSNNKKSVEQCKNKIDNLKKRYKVEFQRININGGGFGNSTSWHWFKQIEAIMGNSYNTKTVGSGENDCDRNANMMPKQIKRYSSSNAVFANNLKPKPVLNLRWRRVVFKISGASLAANCQNIDPKVAMQIAREVATACRLGLEVAIVVGGRNFFCGDSWISATGLERPTAYQIGMMATVMNSILVQSALEKQGIQTRVQSAFSMPELVEPYSRQRAIRHLEKGRVVIFGGVGAGAGNPLFTTDTAAALRASEINADVLLKGTNVDGIYDCRSSNVLLEHISFRDVVARGVTFMDIMAITYCEENGIPVVIFNLLEPGNISRALCGNQVGTLIDQAGGIS